MSGAYEPTGALSSLGGAALEAADQTVPAAIALRARKSATDVAQFRRVTRRSHRPHGLQGANVLSPLAPRGPVAGLAKCRRDRLHVSRRRPANGRSLS